MTNWVCFNRKFIIENDCCSLDVAVWAHQDAIRFLFNRKIVDFRIVYQFLCADFNSGASKVRQSIEDGLSAAMHELKVLIPYGRRQKLECAPQGL